MDMITIKVRHCSICGARVRNCNPRCTTCDSVCTRAKKAGRSRVDQLAWEMRVGYRKVSREIGEYNSVKG